MADTSDHSEFDDIRPYHDSEVPGVMARLIADREMADTILTMRYPRAARSLGWALRPFVRRALHRAFDDIRTVHDFQLLVGQHFNALLAKDGTRFTVSGIERLGTGAHLFISNHRDIAMDPAFVNLALHENGRDTVRIAIGDNLLSKPFATDLMRINKSFIVKRSATGRREKLTALTTLSRYIRHSIRNDNTSVWIAQREGRAKNGVDRTETALVKMLALGRERGTAFGDAIADLAMVPVSIAYCFDPCDVDKARELHERQVTGSYRKKPHEDLASIYKGIVGAKGHVHVAFGEPLAAPPADDDELAAWLDHQIVGHYRLQPTNIIAWRHLHGTDGRVEAWASRLNADWAALETALLARVSGEHDGVVQQFLSAYAAPVQSLLELGLEPQAQGG
ncbi:MAG: 1-acyl-sn-glycerol-3-phosphate acyltransferase [Porticoccaceae bacterium]|nr:1-acyl-sn-glycerol-3-phosphate acyltransferase [Porticoccaceae bacterium]